MSQSSDEFEAYLAPGEAVVAAARGTLLDDSYRSPGAAAVTDRRILFVSEGEGFVDVAHDAIFSIRGRPRREFTLQGLGPAVVAVLGAGLAVAATVGVLMVQPDPLAFLLLLATVGGVGIAERVRRRDDEVEWRARDGSLGALAGALPAGEPLEGSLSRLRDRLSISPGSTATVRGDTDLLVLAIASASLTALIGLVAATGSLLVVPLVLATVCGVALAEYGYRRHRERDALGADRPVGRDVSIHLLDGTAVHLRVDSNGRFDRVLSAVVRESAERPAATAEPSRS